MVFGYLAMDHVEIIVIHDEEMNIPRYEITGTIGVVGVSRAVCFEIQVSRLG